MAAAWCTKKMLLKVLNTLDRWQVFLTEKLPVVLVAFIGASFSMIVLANYSEDTTTITNAAFAITATLTALALAYSRSLDAKRLRDRMLYVGERLFHSSILMLVASLLKYVLLHAAKIEGIKANDLLNSIVLDPVGVLAGLTFMYAVFNAHTALRIANDELWKRQRRHKDWDHLW